MNDETSTAASVENRRLAAIMFTDMVGFSRQMGANETRTLRVLAVHNQVIQQAATAHHGTVIKTIGDAFLVDFPSVVHAVQCAQQIQAQFKAHNAEQEPAEQIHVRIGIHSGDIVQRDSDVFGDGVNIASRLQALAEPDTGCISDMVYRDVAQKVALGAIVSLGRPKLKNIVQRQHVYLLLPEPPKGIHQRLQVQRLKLSRRVSPTSRALAVALLLLAGGLLAGRYFWRSPLRTQDSALRTPAPLALPDKPSIAVMAFVNMSNDPEQEYFSDGITEDITSSLSRISSLFVIAHSSVVIYKGKAVKVQNVSRELGVRYVLEGSVRKAAEQIRISAQLIDATTGEHLWSERFDRPLKDVFALQDEIVQKIVTTLKLQITLTEQGFIVRKTTDNLEAYDYLLRGIEPFFRYTPETNAQARQLWEKAVALDPQYAEAYAWLSWTYWREAAARWSADPQTLERALTLARQALALDDSLPRAHAVPSFVYVLQQQYEQAIAEGDQATTLDPNNAELYTMRAFVLNSAGRPEAALKMVEQAMRLNPRYPPSYLFQLGWAYLGTGRYAEAVATLKELISRSPNFLYAHSLLAFSYVQLWAFQ
ncbi:MAG: adenylate/guanylate cyclase domain-containing protein, partial [Deltaproteobacteria bacterium]|nr:adenylate/guanylate cyclase domain-containing protein [Deltaproteobacteria bacterium]